LPAEISAAATLVAVDNKPMDGLRRSRNGEACAA
jgi:hypothetical protein